MQITRQFLLIISFLALSTIVKAQLYFPPNTSDDWDTIAPATLGWCDRKVDSLYSFLESTNTKAFLLLKDGKIVLEQYFNGHSASDNWYWASAGKTLTAFMVGIAQQENYLNISDTTATYLGQGWTSCTPTQEAKITIRHQLTMTSGLNDGVPNTDCTQDTCLQYLSDAGTRWAYHNAPYTLLDGVIENATGQSLNLYTTQKVKNITGMNGAYIQQGDNNVFFSTPRSMARFGLLMLNEGNWNGNQILGDTTYFNEMTQTSQPLNESYGYLWWLNSGNTYMIPQTQLVFPGRLFPNAPSDMYSALGKNGQFINIVPSQNLVWIRMGNAPDNSLISYTLNEDIWNYINDLDCASSLQEQRKAVNQFTAYPNPVKDFLWLKTDENSAAFTYQLYDNGGRFLKSGQFQDKMNLSHLSAGIYYLHLSDGEYFETIKVIKE